MGIDARLVCNNGISYYYDREHTISGHCLEYDDINYKRWIELSERDGLSKKQTLKYLKYLLKNKKYYNYKNTINNCINFINTLDDNSIIKSINDTQDEYFDIDRKLSVN